MPEEMNPTPELRSCPFCGYDKAAERREIVHQGDNGDWCHVLFCPNCAMALPAYLNRDCAIEAWNRRAADPRAAGGDEGIMVLLREAGCSGKDVVLMVEDAIRRIEQAEARVAELRDRVGATMDAWRALIRHRTPVAVGAKPTDDEHRHQDTMLYDALAHCMTRLGNVPCAPITLDAAGQPAAARTKRYHIDHENNDMWGEEIETVARSLYDVACSMRPEVTHPAWERITTERRAAVIKYARAVVTGKAEQPAPRGECDAEFTVFTWRDGLVWISGKHGTELIWGKGATQQDAIDDLCKTAAEATAMENDDPMPDWSRVNTDNGGGGGVEVERVAIAIGLYRHGMSADTDPRWWAEMDEESRNEYRAEARAALKAMGRA